MVHEEHRKAEVHETFEEPVVEQKIMKTVVKNEGLIAPLIKEENFLANKETGTLPAG